MVEHWVFAGVIKDLEKMHITWVMQVDPLNAIPHILTIERQGEIKTGHTEEKEGRGEEEAMGPRGRDWDDAAQPGMHPAARATRSKRRSSPRAF